MPNLTSVHVTSGVPDLGTGTVSTLDAVMALLPVGLGAHGGLVVEGVTSGVAVPVSNALGATVAKQPALGTAGTASTDVITVQGIAAMTALKVDGSAVTQPVSGTVTSNRTVSTPVLISALTTTQTVIGSAATLMSYYIYNPNSSVAYVQIFDISGSVTLGASTPKWSIGIPATSGANLAGLDLTFTNAIKVAATTTATGASTAATGLECNFGYR